MKGFNVKDGKITRDLSPYETVYLMNDVVGLIDHWVDYFNQKLKELENMDEMDEAKKEKEFEKYNGAIWSLNILRNDLN